MSETRTTDREYEDEWTSVRLSDVATKRAENVDPNESNLERHIGLEHIKPNTPKPNWEPISNVTSTKRRFYAGDILFAKLRPNLKKAAQPSFSGVCSTDIFTISTNSDTNNKFLLYRLSSKSAFDWATRTSAGTRMPRTSWDLFKNFEFGLPPITEQRAIAAVLWNVDRAIQNSEEIVEKSERIYKGIMQKFLRSGYNDHNQFAETKCGSVPAEWDIVPVSEVATRVGSGGTPDTSNEDYYSGETPWVKTDDLSGDLITETKTKITEAGLESSATKLFPEGTVIFAMYGGSLGQNGRLGMEAAMNQACCGIVPDENRINPYFLHQQLVHRKNQLVALGAGTHQQNLTQSTIENFELFVPDLSEQKQIVDVIRNVEREVRVHQMYVSELSEIKHGLMQDLLSGKTRVSEDRINGINEVIESV